MLRARSHMAWALALSIASLIGCTDKPTAPAPRSSASSLDEMDASRSTSPSPAAVDASTLDASAEVPAPALDARAPTQNPEPRTTAVKIVTSGMHVGGGPFDEITKEPMKRSVEPRFPELARCWQHVSRPQQAYFGVDLVIEANGGKARVSNPRTKLQGEGFVACVVTFFESVVFEKPRNGKSVVSYSVQFTPTSSP